MARSRRLPLAESRFGNAAKELPSATGPLQVLESTEGWHRDICKVVVEIKVIGCYWLLLVVIGCYWLLLVVIGCYWLLLVVIGCYWLLFFVIRCYWLLLVVIRCY